MALPIIQSCLSALVASTIAFASTGRLCWSSIDRWIAPTSASAIPIPSIIIAATIVAPATITWETGHDAVVVIGGASCRDGRDTGLLWLLIRQHPVIIARTHQAVIGIG